MADKLQSVYDALKTDGQFQQARSFQDFKNKMAYQGYRSQIYKNLKDAGANVGTFSHFTSSLGYQSGSPKTKQTSQKQSKLMQAAQQVGQGFQPSGETSAFVQSLYEQDNAEQESANNPLARPIDYTSKDAVKGIVDRTSQRNNARQQATSKAVVDDVRKKASQQYQPIVSTGTPADYSVVKNQGQLLDEMQNSASEFVKNNLTADINNAIAGEFNAGHKRGMDAIANTPPAATVGNPTNNIFAGIRDAQAYNREIDPDKLLANLSQKFGDNVKNLMSDPSRKQQILEQANRLGVTPEAYIQNAVAPKIQEQLQQQFDKNETLRHMPRGDAEYVIGGLMDSVYGSLLNAAITTKSQRQYQQKALQEYKPSRAAELGRSVVTLTGDAPIMGGIGKGVGAGMKAALGNTAAKAANMSTLGRLAYLSGTGAVSGAANFSAYEGLGGMIQYASTSDDTSVGQFASNILKAGGERAAHGAVSGAALGTIGGVLGSFGTNLGIKAADRTLGKKILHGSEKLGYEGLKVVGEGIGFATGDVINDVIINHPEGVTITDTLQDAADEFRKKLPESIATAAVFKATNHGTLTKAIMSPKDFAKSIVMSAEGQTSQFKFTPEEKQQLFNTGLGEEMGVKDGNILSWARKAKNRQKYDDPYLNEDTAMIRTYYDRIMADPNIAWKTKAKFTALVGGAMPTSAPIHSYSTFSLENSGDKNVGYVNYVNSYAKDGTLIERQRYNTAEERDAIKYRLESEAEQKSFQNTLGFSLITDMADSRMKETFLRQAGWKEDEPADSPTNKKLLEDLENGDSELSKQYKDFCWKNGSVSRLASEVMNKYNVTPEEFWNAADKDPMKRTDNEQRMIIEYKNAVHASLEKAGEPYPELAAEDGKELVREAALGTDAPNNKMVISELDKLTQAEKALEEAAAGNDLLREGMEAMRKQGLSPLDMYQEFLNPESPFAGMNKEQLAPLAEYINQSARVQGMMQGTQQKIEENVNAFVSEWAYKGTLDGQRVEDGSQVIFVKDELGNTLILGRGDVAFDENGRPKEGIGDMVMCYEPATNEMKPVSVKDITFAGSELSEEYANSRKQVLQAKNEEAYVAAAQAQAETSSNNAAAPEGSSTPKAEKKDGQKSKSQGNYRDRLEAAGVVGKSESPVGMIEFNPANGNATSLSNSLAMMIEKRVERTLDNPDSTIQDLHDAIVFTLADGNGRVSASTSVLTDVYNAFNAMKEGKLSKTDVLDYVKELMYTKDKLTSGAQESTPIQTDPTPIGTSAFGNVYDAFRGKVKEAFDFLLKHKSGDLQGVFSRNDVGDIDLIWGDRSKNQGLDHIIDKHIEQHNDFASVEEAAKVIEDVITNGTINEKKSRWDKVVLEKDGYMVVIRKNVRNENGDIVVSNKNWIVTAFDNNHQAEYKKRTPSDVTRATPNTVDGGRAVTPDGSPFAAKVQQNPETPVNNSEKLKLSDGRDVPLDEKGEPDFMKMEAKDGAEVYQTLFPDTYEAEIDNAVKSAEKALRDANKMKPKGKGIMERAKEQQNIKETVALAEQQLEKAKAIKRSLTEQKIASTIESQKPTAEPSKEISDEVRDKFQNAPKVKGTEGSITLPDGTEIDGTYYLVSSESLTPSHDANNGYKANEGLPTNPDGSTLNDRDYEHDKSYRQDTDKAARSYDGRALNDVPIISDEGFVYSGNGRTMAGQKAAVEGTDGKYIDNLKKNAGRFGLTREQIENSDIEHPRVVFVPKERLPYDTATMRKFNKEDKKSESNVAEAVANSKTLTSTDVGSIIAAIEGSGKDGAVGTIESFFNSPKAISGLVKTLQEKGILGSNEVAKYMDGDLLSAQGKEYVKNLLLGSMFKEETIRMMGIESTLKNKAISAIRTIMENQKLGDYSLRDEIDQAIKLLYEAKTKGDKVDTLLRTIDAFNGNAADRYPSISQMMAIALEGKVGDFRDLLDSYNRNAAQHNTNEGTLFGDKPTKEEFINEFLNFKNWKDYGTRHSEEKADVHVGGIQGNEPQAPGANGERPTTETKQGVEPLKTNNDGRQEETANGNNDDQSEDNGIGVDRIRTREVSPLADEGNLQMLGEEMASLRSEHLSDSERNRRRAASERLVEKAKESGDYISEKETRKLGERNPNHTGESVIYIDKENGKVYKVKDPYAKSAMKSGVQPEDAPFEHYVHNILFPDTRYTLEAISDVNGEVRLVLSQNYIKSAGRATKEQIEEALAKLGLVKEDGYSYGNEYVSVTDVEGDNVLVGADGKVYFIDPIIRFKKPLSEILGKMQIGKRRKSLFYIAMSDWVKTPVEREREKKEADAEAERQKLAEIESKFQEEKQKFKGKEKYNDYAQVLSSSKTIREAVDKLHKKAEACRKEAEDWRSRQYKTNNTVIDSYNIYGEEKTTTISAANERRRQSAIRNAENAAKEYDEMADTLLSRCGLPKDYFAEKPRNLSDPIASIKTNAEQFKTEKQSSAKWYGNPEEMPGYEKMMRSQKSALLKDAATAYQKAFDEVSKDNDFFGGHQDEVTYEDFAKAYREVTDDYSFKHDEPFLPALFEHLSKKLDAAVEARRAERKGAAEQTETVEKETEEAAIDRIYEKANKLVQDWEDRILDYIAEHYPTQANVSAKSSSPQGLKEREAMRSDETLKKMREQYKSESDTAIKEADAEYDKWLEENGKDKLPSYEEKPYDRVAADKKLDELSKKADSLIESLELVDKAHGYINEYREHVKNGDKEKAESVLKDLRTSLDAIIRGSGKNLSDTERRKIVDERIAKIDTELNSNLRQQKADTPSEISEREAALRDAVISKIKQSGIEVVTDVEEGQRMLDLVNDVFLSKRNGKKKGTETALPSDKSPFKGTVVSSSDGAKVLKKVDTLVNDLEKTLPALDKNFIGYVAKAFGMERPATSSSQYATFETVNGDVVTFRLSDHNARQSGFDGAGRDNGISIVISRKSNNGITEDGDAHIVEFYYSDKALRQADGHPLAEIVKSMKQALYSGEYNDTTGLAERGEVPSGVIREMKVYHGSGADFTEFDHSHMGEGEGNQSFGWGTYVTEVEGIGRNYAEGNTQDYHNPIIRAYFKAVRKEVENGVPFEEAKQQALARLDKLRKSIEGKEDAYASFIAAHERFKGLKEEDLANRHLYTVEIPEDNGKNYLEWNKEYNENEVYEIVERMLDKAVEYEKRGDWDKGEQFRDVANALAERIDKEVSDKDGKGTLSGELLYYNVNTDAKTASELLNEAGFVGIKYPAGYFSGGNPEGNKNYVIFNEADAKITNHIRYFKTSNGHAYGYTDGKKIYIDPRIATSETPIHEYTHLWATALKNTNQKGWADVVRLMKGTDVWNKVTEKYPELKTDDEIADEVLAQFSGKRGAERLRQMAEGINPGDVMKKTEVLSTVGKIKQALEKFWNYVKEDILGIQRRFKSAEEIADSVMKDLMDGVNPTKAATEDGSRLQKEEVKNGEDNKTAKELFLSLQNKTDNKDYNGTVTNLARRVAEGKARVVRFGTRAERKEPGDAPTTAGYLFATGTDGLHLGSGAIPTKDYSFPLGKGETTSIRTTIGDTSTTRERGFGEVAKDDGTSIEKLRNDIYNRLEDWSKENGYLFNETDIEKNSLDGKKWNEGCEAVVYRSKDGRNVTKVSAIDPYYANGLLRMIDRAAAHKMVFPDTAYTIKGYGREKNGKFSVVTEQPFVEGKTVIEYFNGDLRKANEYIDNYMRSIGFKEKYDRDYDDTVWSNGKYTVYDTNASNVIIDKDGKPHVIDCEVLPVGYSKIDKFEIVDAKGGTHFRESNAPQQSQTREVVSNHIDQVVKKVGGKVKKVNSIEEVTNTNARKAIEEGRKITGWYEEATGEVHLYMPNIHDRYTAEKTVWHELVGHQGLRGLFGDKFNTFMRSLWYDLDNPVNKELREYVNANLARNKFDVYDTIEEFCAEQAEKGRGEAGFWNNIRNKFTDVLHEIGYRIAPNTKDVKYLLWLGKNLQKHPNDPVWKMRQESVLHKLENERVPSVIEQHGVIMENNGKHTSLDDLPRHEYNEATDGKVHFMTSPNKSFEIEQYNNALSSKAYAFKESTVDAMQSLQEAMLAISPKYKKVEDIPAYMNPYLAQNRAQSMEQQKGEAFERSLAKPLTKIFSKVVDSFTGKDLTERSRNAQLYMIAKSGLERNRVFYVRDAVRKLMDDDATKQQGKQLQQDWETLKRGAGQALESGKIDLTEYYEHLDDFIRTNIDDKYNAGEHDYAGFHGMYDLADGEAYNDAEVIEKVKDAEACMGDAATKELWKRINDVTSYSLTEDYNNGFIDKPTHDHVQGMMDWYVPMRKFDEVTAEDVYGYITEKGDPRNNLGSTLMNAKGRTSLADTNVLAQMMAMASGSIHRGVQNGIKQHLLRFINSEEKDKAVSDRLFVETKAWMEKHTVAGKDEWVEVYPQINGTTPKDISASIAAFENRMQSLKAQGLAKEVTDRGDVGYKFVRAKDKSEHLVEVMVGGKKKVFVCQGNPRVAQAVNGMLKNSGAKFKRISNFTRIAAQLSTSWNPDFVLSNMRRDFHFASANIFSKEGAKFALQFEKQYHSNLASFMQKNDNDYYGYFSKFRNGTLGNSKKEQMFREFMENGGETGFTQLHTMEQWTKDINDAVNLDKSKSAKLSKAFKSKTVDVIEAANEIVENIARFSAYCTSREAGRSVGRSIYDAKEVSTNFNRSGSGDAIKTLKTENDTASDATFRSSLGAFNSYMRNYTMFYNAGIQGAALFTKNLKQNTIRAAVSMTAIPFTLGAGAMPIINAALIAMEDEKDRDGMKDPYAELPDYQRRNNICIYIGNGRFYDIPLPIEMRAFYGIGDLAAGYLFNERLRSDGNLTSDIIGQLAQIVPATDFLGHHAPGDTPQQVLADVAGTFVPQALKPLYEVGMNRNWTGRPIYKDSDYLNDAPSWKKSYASTNEWLMNFNKFLNKQTNGIDNTNEDLKGNATLDWLSHPGGIQALYEGYLGGLGTSGRRLGETMQKVGGIAKGAVTGDGSLNELKNLDFNQVPIVRTFLYTPREGSDMQRTKTKWYNYKEELSTASYNLQQLNHKTSDPLKALRNAAAKHRFAKSVEGIAIDKMKGYEKSMKRWKKKEALASSPDAIKNAQLQQNLIMQEAVDELDRLYDVGMKQKQ